MAALYLALVLLPLSDGRLIVRRTPLAGTLPAMVLPTTERTTQVHASCVPGMRKKPNPAIHAVCQATLQIRLRFQDRIQRDLILPDKRTGAIVFVPIRLKRENFLDGDDKKARLSVITWIVLCTASAYLNEAKASRGRPRFFMRHEPRNTVLRPRDRSPAYRSPNQQLLPCRHSFAAPPMLKRLLGKKNPHNLLLSK
jgi:hypothetical protein